MTQAEALYHLQEIDLNLVRIQKRLSEIHTALTNNQTIIEAKESVTAAQKALTPLHTKARNFELEIQTNADKIRLTDERLYSGKVRNPKELQDMQQEIQSLKKRNSELEDSLLEVMVEVEGAETSLKKAEIQLQQITQNWENEHSHLLDEQIRLKAELTQVQQQHESAVKAVEPENLKTYNNLRPRKNNQPVALLINESCSVCRVEQNRAVVSEARKSQSLVLCQSCGRILVFK
jgi:predicted  nucleic acid-binding Zn-ribbon protein